MTAPLIPPRYVNVPSSVAFSNDLPNPLFRTYARLVGLAWRDERQARLPVLDLDDLCVICHLQPRAMRLHLQDLGRHNLIICDGDQNGFRIRIVAPAVEESSVQNFALPVLPLRDAGGDSPPSAEPVQNFALDSPTARANLQALVEFGVNSHVPDARQVAVLPHVTPDLIRAWGQNLVQRPDTRNLPGRLLYTLSTNRAMPRPETRGGDRSSGARPSPSQPSLPLLSAQEPAPDRDDGQAGTGDSGDCLPDIDDDRANLLLHLAQEQRDPLDRGLAYALVQPYTRSQVIKVVHYVRTAKGLTRSRLGAAIQRLRAGDVPDIALPRSERERYAVEVKTCAGDCSSLYREDKLCPDCGRCGGCCPCNAVDEEPETDARTMDKRPGPRPADPSQPMQPHEIWQAVLGELPLQMTRETFNTWLKPTRLVSREGDVFTVGVENGHVKKWLSNRLLTTIQRTVASIAGKEKDEVEIKFVVWTGEQEGA